MYIIYIYTYIYKIYWPIYYCLHVHGFRFDYLELDKFSGSLFLKRDESHSLCSHCIPE